jgi:hypothetical protein
MQDTQRLVQDYLARGGEIKLCPRSLAPVCVPISSGPRGSVTQAVVTPRKLEAAMIVSLFRRRV